MEKLKNNLGFFIVSCVLVLIPVIVGLILWNQLPNQIATHFGADGMADGWSSKPVAVLGMPCIILAVHVLCAVVTAIDPKQQGISDKIYRLILLICPMTSLFVSVLMFSNALDMKLDVMMILNLFLGVLFLVLGNYLPKCKQNYTVGIKVPWTLDNEENWNKTHRFAGFLWVIGGLLMVINAFVNFGGVVFILVVSLVIGLLPMGYSLVFYFKHKEA